MASTTRTTQHTSQFTNSPVQVHKHRRGHRQHSIFQLTGTSRQHTHRRFLTRFANRVTINNQDVNIPQRGQVSPGPTQTGLSNRHRNRYISHTFNHQVSAKNRMQINTRSQTSVSRTTQITGRFRHFTGHRRVTRRVRIRLFIRNFFNRIISRLRRHSANIISRGVRHTMITFSNFRRARSINNITRIDLGTSNTTTLHLGLHSSNININFTQHMISRSSNTLHNGYLNSPNTSTF